MHSCIKTLLVYLMNTWQADCCNLQLRWKRTDYVPREQSTHNIWTFLYAFQSKFSHRALLVYTKSWSKYRWQCFILVNAVISISRMPTAGSRTIYIPDTQIHTLFCSSSKIVPTSQIFINTGWDPKSLHSNLLVKIIWQCSTLLSPILRCVILKCITFLQWVFLVLKQQYKIPECPMKVQ